MALIAGCAEMPTNGCFHNLTAMTCYENGQIVSNRWLTETEQRAAIIEYQNEQANYRAALPGLMDAAGDLGYAIGGGTQQQPGYLYIAPQPW